MKGILTSDTEPKAALLQPVVIPRDQHNIAQKDISPNALKVLHRLNSAGYQAYLVGGCVRDLMLGLHPKDFDVATNATPEQVKQQFNNCRLIGRRFRLAHVLFGREIIEVATFRGHHEQGNGKDNISKQSEQGQLLRDNVFGNINEDAQRRDFTINAMYYNGADCSVSDFAKGIEAIKNRSIDLIGNPEQRYREDPVRMLRAVRFAVKLNMQISERSAAPIKPMANLLSNIPPARLFEEVLKLLVSGRGLATYQLLNQYGLFTPMFPQLADMLTDDSGKESQFLTAVLTNTDNRINSDQRVTPAFLLAALMWYPLEERCQQIMFETDMMRHDAFNLAINDVLHRQTQRVMIPKRYSNMIRDVWLLQQRLPRRFGRRAYQLLEHPKFRAAYDFLLLRGEVEGGDLLELAQWWTQFQQPDGEQRKKMLDALQEKGGRRHPRRRSRKRKTANPE